MLNRPKPRAREPALLCLILVCLASSCSGAMNETRFPLGPHNFDAFKPPEEVPFELRCVPEPVSGRVVAMFVTPSCPPCHGMLHDLEPFRVPLAEADITVVPVLVGSYSCDDAATESDITGYPTALMSEAMARRFVVASFPRTVVIVLDDGGAQLWYQIRGRVSATALYRYLTDGVPATSED